nr:unnamed protein product [Callosobruchus chinensis]
MTLITPGNREKKARTVFRRKMKNRPPD